MGRYIGRVIGQSTLIINDRFGPKMCRAKRSKHMLAEMKYQKNQHRFVWELYFTRKVIVSTVIFLSVLWMAFPAFSQDDDNADTLLNTDEPVKSDDLDGEDLMNMDIEDLLKINVLDVSSVTGIKQDIFQTPAAISVLTSEDIRRAGFINIPEALRMVPGLDVARIASNQWAISSRGFNSRFANKLQVLVDGRSVYEPLFAGVFWNEVDMNIEDLDRIEVIRGPGATLWGANAVHGVINITSKSAKDTVGSFATGGYGNELDEFGAFRYGAALDDDSFFRIWGKYINYGGFVDAAGNDRPDDWDVFHGGARFDFNTDSENVFTLITNVEQTTRLGEGVRIPVNTGHFATVVKRSDGRSTNANILGRLRHEESPEKWWQLQGYFTYIDRVGVAGLEEVRNTVNLDYRQAAMFGDQHQLLWGLELNVSNDNIQNGPQISFDPSSRTASRISGFLQDTIELKKDFWHLMIGSKFEHNNYTGFEIQPSARLWWTPDDDNTVWASVSRPVRTPSRFESDFSLIGAFGDTGLLAGGPPSGIIIPLTLNGKKNIESERFLTYELGYRRKFSDTLSFDLSSFITRGDNLISNPTNNLGQLSNNGSGESYGVELSSDWQVAENWKLTGSYSFIKSYLHGGGTNQTAETDTPENQFQIRSALDITKDLEFNSAVYFVDNVSDRGAKAYTRLDLGLTWRPRENFEIAVWGQNLLDPSHREFSETVFKDNAAEVERTLFVQATIRF